MMLSAAPGGGGGGSGSNKALAEEARLFYFPRSVINNSNVMVDLSEPNSMNASDFTETFSNYSDDNLALFRIRETLSSNPGATNQTSDSGTIAITIESTDGWTFVNENNYTRTSPFTLDVFCVEESLNYLNTSSDYGYTTNTVQLGTSTTLPSSRSSASLTYSGGYYTLVLPYTFFSKGVQRYYPAYIRSADICLNIPTFDSNLEAGYYSTNLVVRIPAHTEYDANKSSSLVGEQVINIAVRGYLGVDASSNGSSSFVVLSSADTYTMDLGISANPTNGYSVAQAKFVYNNVVESLPNNADTKYTVYVSPTANYTDTTSEFRFIKIGSESQARSDINTIYYTLEWTGKNSTPPILHEAHLHQHPDIKCQHRRNRKEFVPHLMGHGHHGHPQAYERFSGDKSNPSGGYVLLIHILHLGDERLAYSLVNLFSKITYFTLFRPLLLINGKTTTTL